MNINNEIYRRIKTAYHLHDKELNEIWADTLYPHLTYNKTKFFAVNDDHKKSIKISGKQLKEFLASLCRHKSVVTTGFSIASLVGSLAEGEGIVSTGNPVKDAGLLREKLRG